MSKTRILAHLALLIVSLLYAASYTIIKEIMPAYISASGFIVVRVVGALFLLALVQKFIIKEKIPERKDLLKLALCSVFGVAVNMLMFFKGLQYTNPINAALIMTTIPVFVLIFAWIILKERITWIKSVGIALGASGAGLLIVSQGGGAGFGGEQVIGDLLIMLNALSFSLFLVLVKPLMEKYHPMTVTTWVFFFGMFLVLPFGVGDLQAARWADLTPLLWLGVVFVVFGATFLTYALNAWGLKYVETSVVSSYVYLQPFLATIIAVSTGKYLLLPEHVLYALLIFSGVYLVGKKKKKKLLKE